MADTMTRGQIQDLVGKFASENPKYRAALLSNPKGTIEKQLNTQLGAVTVKAVADTADTVHVVIPYAAAEGELSDSRPGARRWRQAGHHGELPRARWHGGQQHRHAAEPVILFNGARPRTIRPHRNARSTDVGPGVSFSAPGNRGFSSGRGRLVESATETGGAMPADLELIPATRIVYSHGWGALPTTTSWATWPRGGPLPEGGARRRPGRRSAISAQSKAWTP